MHTEGNNKDLLQRCVNVHSYTVFMSQTYVQLDETII